MSKYNIFVVSPSDVSSVLHQLENPDLPKTSRVSSKKATHECLADSHLVELSRLVLSAKMMFHFDDLKSHLTRVENLPVHNQALSAYLKHNGYTPSKVKDLKTNSTTTLWKHNKSRFFS